MVRRRATSLTAALLLTGAALATTVAPAAAAPGTAGTATGATRSTAAAAAVPLPTADPFYTYAGATPLAQIPPGTVLDTRAVTLTVDTQSNPLPATVLPSGFTPVLSAEQLLYRTSDELGRPSATVTTVLRPLTSAATPNVVAYLSFYDSLSSKCDPSYTLRGGDPNVGSSGTPNTGLTDVEQLLVQAYALNSIVTVPDFEGEHLDWTAGHEAGYGTLDAVRATESWLRLPTSTQVGLTGYSGGSIAADWASELAPSYARELNIVGVAEGGVPVHFAHNLDYIEGTTDWAPVIPATIATLSRSYGVDLSPYLSDQGLAAVAATRDQCIGDFATYGSGPTANTIQALLKPQYQDPYAIAPFVQIINQLIMGTGPSTPKGPLYLEVGNDPSRKQGQGDDIMITADVQALAHEYCTRGVPLQFQVAQGDAHTQAAIPFEQNAITFLEQRFAGAPFSAESCDAVGVGNSLAPVTLHTTSTPPSTTPSGTPARTTAGTPATARPATGSLAVTGAGPVLPTAGGLLLLAGATALVLRRRASRG